MQDRIYKVGHLDQPALPQQDQSHKSYRASVAKGAMKSCNLAIPTRMF